MKKLWFGRELVGEALRRAIGDVAIGAVDHDRQKIGVQRERPVERDLVLPPRQVCRQQLFDIGVHREVTGRIPTGHQHQEQRGERVGDGMAAAEIDEAGDERGDHTAPRPRTEWKFGLTVSLNGSSARVEAA